MGKRGVKKEAGRPERRGEWLPTEQIGGWIGHKRRKRRKNGGSGWAGEGELGGGGGRSYCPRNRRKDTEGGWGRCKRRGVGSLGLGVIEGFQKV